MYDAELRDEDGSTEHRNIEAENDNEAIELAKSAAEDWVLDGEWGNDGALVWVGIVVVDEDGDDVYDESIEVEIEPNHEALITEAAHGHDICGFSPEDHNWTSEGEGGCKENPGVWSHGGTKMSFSSHCRKCGLSRTEVSLGTQRNPGEHDTVEYRMLTDDMIEHLRKIGAMGEAEKNEEEEEEEKKPIPRQP